MKIFIKDIHFDSKIILSISELIVIFKVLNIIFHHLSEIKWNEIFIPFFEPLIQIVQVFFINL
jgi:hypothetical protein